MILRMTDIERLALVRQYCTSGEARRRRIAARVSLAEVAKECGVHAYTVHRWERGERLPRTEAGLRFLSVLESLTALETAS